MAATQDKLGQLHEKVATALADRLDSGEATAADINAAIAFLKNNSITCVAEGDNAMAELQRRAEERRTQRANRLKLVSNGSAQPDATDLGVAEQEAKFL